MTNPFLHGSSGLPDSNLPSVASGLLPRRFQYAPAPNNAPSGSNFLTHPARTSVLAHLLNPSDDMTSDTTFHHHHPARSMDLDADRGVGGTTGASARQSAAPFRQPPINSLSRAFQLFAGGNVPDAPSDGFFIPSYLRGSAYAQKLEDIHREKSLTQRDGHHLHPPVLGLSHSPSNGSLQGKTPLTHRGMTLDVIEKPPPFEDDELIPLLPSRWNKDDRWPGLDITDDGQEIRQTHPKPHNDQEACAVRADHPIPPQCGIYYYEATIMQGRRDDTTIGIGLSSRVVSLSRPPGWEPESWGYHGDDGHCFSSSSTGKTYGPKFSVGDIVGCGINFHTGNVFYTKNGVHLGVAFRDVKWGRLYPSVGTKKPGESVRVNFGQTPFAFDIDSMMRKEKDLVRDQILGARTTTLAPLLSETELVQSLVLQFLQHDGYVETARAFAEEVHTEKRALAIQPNAVVDDISFKDDQDANTRQRIRRAILEGDIDKALKLTNAHYSQVLRDNEQVYFRLRCRRFIEMVRKAAEINMFGDGRKTNGHSAINLDGASQEMDLDTNGFESHDHWDQMDTEDGIDPRGDLSSLERETLEYGQKLQAEYREDPRREVSKALGEIWSLMAYPNPLKEPKVAHLLDRKGRVAVAEELNSAILTSLGKSARAHLETLYAQTNVLLDDLRQDGGAGAFVSLQDVLDEIPHTHQY